MRKGLLLVAIVAVVSGPVLAKEKLRSFWLDREIAVDGALDEWKDATILLDDPVMLVGTFNDHDYLYVSFSFREPRIARQVMARGLILELDAKGEDPLRIQFPIGIFDGDPRPAHQRSPVNRERIREEIERSQETFLLLGPGSSDRQRMAADNPFGISVRTSMYESRFNYEIKVPLSRDENHPFAIGADAGSTLSLSLEMPEMKRPEGIDPGGGMPGGGAGRMAGGGMRGGGGVGMRGGVLGGGGTSGHRDGMRPEPIHLRAKLTLAVNPAKDDLAD